MMPFPRKACERETTDPMTQHVFAIAAHPDDVEFVMAGTLIRLRDAGYELHYMNIANGCCGSTEHDVATAARIRRQEAMHAAHSIGAVFHESLTNDLEILYDLPTLRRIGSIVREVAPDIVLTHSPVDYMEDHTNACRLAVTAAFSRAMPNFPVDPPVPVRVTIEGGAGERALLIPRRAVSQALRALLQNARHASPPGSEIDLSASAHRESLEAMGIAPSQVATDVVDAVKSGKFWIFTHPISKPVALSRFEDLQADRNPTNAYDRLTR